MFIFKGFTVLLILQFCNSFPLKTIISSFQENRSAGSIRCVLLISDHHIKDYQDDIYLPIYQTNLETTNNFIEQGKYCGHILILLKDASHLDKILKSKIISNVEKVAVVFETFLNLKIVKKAFKGIKQINNLVVFVKRETTGYTIYRRNDKHKDGIELANILIEDAFLFPEKAIFGNKLHGLHGKEIKVTSFDRKPFAYKNNKGEYEGYEVSLMKDLSKSMGFTWNVVAPTDGGLWGEIKSDGSATGLVGDIKV